MGYLKKYSNLIYKVLLAFVFILAIALRFKVYLQECSLWLDEAALALNILKRGLFGFFSPLDYQQCCPPLFMMMTKIMVTIFGDYEKVYRVIPFCAGIGSIPVFYYFSKEFFNNKWIILFVNYLFAVNYSLIVFCFEFKPYMLDAFLFMSSFLLLKKVNFNSKKHLILVALSFAILPYLTLPILFLIAAWDICMLIYKRVDFKKLLLINLPFIFSMLFYLFKLLIPSKKIMFSVWGEYWKEHSLYNIESFRATLDWIFYPNEYLFVNFIVLIVSWIYFVKSKKQSNILLFIVLCLLIFAGFCNLYPFYQRMILFFLPVLLIVFVYTLTSKNKIWSVIIILCLFKYNLSYIINDVTKFPLRMYTKGFVFDVPKLIPKLQEIYVDGDFILVQPRFIYAFIYYKNKLNFHSNAGLFISMPAITKEESSKFYDLLQERAKGDLIFFIVCDGARIKDFVNLDDWLKNKNVVKEIRLKQFPSDARIIKVKK